MKSDLKTYTEPAFLACVTVLALAVAGMSIAVSYLGVKMIKQPLPLRKSLDIMNEKALSPYKVVSKYIISNDDIIEALGTKDYIQWTLEDTSVGKSSQVRYCSLFITYYTGNPDQVPHVPEECYFGGGHQSFGAKDVTINVDLKKRLAENSLTDKYETQKLLLPVRSLVFSSKSDDVWQTDAKFPVFYTFKVNGKYAGNRNTTRAVLSANLFTKYSYFSKIEWKFYNLTYGKKAYPETDEAIKASRKLLSTVLSVLESDHWPDWEKAAREK